MTTQSDNPFEHIFPTRYWWKTVAWRVVAWSILGAILLVLQIFCLYLIVDLFNSGGQLVMTKKTDTERLTQLVGKDLVPIDLDSGEIPTGSGILPSVWSSRNRPWGAALALAYRQNPLLRSNSSALLLLLVLTVLLGIIRSAVRSRCRMVAVRVSQEIVGVYRKRIHRQTLRLGPSHLDDHIPNRVVKMFTNGMDDIRNGLIEWIFRIGFFTTTLIALVIVALLVQPVLALQCILPLFVCWYFIRKETVRAESAMRLAESQMDSDARLLSESLHKTRLVRGYSMEKFEQNKFQSNLERFQNSALQAIFGMSKSHRLGRILMLICFTVILFLVGMRVLRLPENPYHMRLSVALLFGLCFAGMYAPLEALRQLKSIYQSVSINADQLFRYLSQVPEVGQTVGAKFLEPISETLIYDKVSYTNPKDEAHKLLDEVTLQIPAKEVTAIISTDIMEAHAMVYMLPRFIEPQQGRILFDKEDTALATLDSLRAETILISPKEPFFTGTVLENLTCGNPNFSLTDATEAAKMVHANHFIQKLYLGYETVLGEHGVDLEPGEAFRLSLARAALRNPALMAICEPDAQFSDDTKKMIDDAYSRLFRNRTTILVPKRLSTLRRANNIVFLHKGKVEAAGTHADLIKTSPLYCHWEYTQFNVFRHKEAGQ